MDSNTMTNLVTQVKPSHAALAVQTMMRARTPTFLWGQPGVGKSQIVAQVAKSLGRSLIDIRAAQFDPVDLRGIPTINGNGLTHWSVPDMLPQAERDGAEGVLFLDELNSAPSSVMAACYQLILDRKLGEYTLPAGWDMVAAGNLESDRGVTNKMPTPLANRFAHFHVIPDVKDWVRWAITAGIRPEIIAFIRFRPELLHAFDPKSGEKTFPTPRSWEFTSRTLEAAPPAEIEFAAYSATVGQAAAAELTGFLRVFRTLPSIDGILVNPLKADVPSDPSTLYALSTALARRATDNNFGAIWTYSKRMPPEFCVLTMSDATTKDPALQHTKAFIEFGSEYADVLL